MSIVKKQHYTLRRINIDLDGPDGNALAIASLARNIARQMGLDVDSIINEMMAGDYINLLRVFEKYFGSVVVFETDQTHLIETLSNG